MNFAPFDATFRLHATLIPGTVDTMNRRRFLQSISALAFWHPRTDTQPVIKRFDDGNQIDVGILRCLTYEDEAGASLTFGVFITTQLPGGWNENRIVPNETLKQRLEQVGFPVVTELWSGFPVHTARMNPCPSPDDIAARLQGVLAGCDPALLYQNSSPRC